MLKKLVLKLKKKKHSKESVINGSTANISGAIFCTELNAATANISSSLSAPISSVPTLTVTNTSGTTLTVDSTTSSQYSPSGNSIWTAGGIGASSPSFFSGIYFDTIGGTGSALNYYEQGTQAFFIGGPWSSANSIEIVVSKLGSQVCCFLPGSSYPATTASTIVNGTNININWYVKESIFSKV